MKPHHLELFTQLIQSLQVQVAIGDGKKVKIYRLPVGLLRERSTVFNKLLPEEGGKEVVRFQILSTTPVATLNAFIAWIMAASPQLDKEDTLEDIVELGILADQLGVWALSNQAMDLIQSQVGSGTWKWSPQALNGVYGTIAAERPLRRLVQATLPAAVDDYKGFMENEEEEDEAWDRVFLAHAALGCDYRRAKKRQENSPSRWPATRENPCEYHEHPWAGAFEADEMSPYDEACAYTTDDCYPVWAVQDGSRSPTIGPEAEVEECPPADEECPPADEECPPVDEECPPATEECPPATEECLPAIEEEVKPRMTVREIKAEIEKLSGKDRKKLKRYTGQSRLVDAAEAQPDDWVHAFGN